MATVRYSDNGLSGRPLHTNPGLIRSGIASTEFFEMTPVIFRGDLLLLGSARKGAEANPFDQRCLWVEDVASTEVRAAFAPGYGLGSAFVEGDCVRAGAVGLTIALRGDVSRAVFLDCRLLETRLAPSARDGLYTSFLLPPIDPWAVGLLIA